MRAERAANADGLAFLGVVLVSVTRRHLWNLHEKTRTSAKHLRHSFSLDCLEEQVTREHRDQGVDRLFDNVNVQGVSKIPIQLFPMKKAKG